MSESKIVSLEKPTEFPKDALTDVLRIGAPQLLAAAVEAEIELHLSRYKSLKDEQGRQAVVRNGYLPDRTIQTGIGPVEVRVPRVRDRRLVPDEEKLRFQSSIVPPYLRKTKSMEELIPWLYLKGISTGDFTEALSALVGKEAPGFSSATISRLKADWQREYDQWRRRDLSGKRYVYLWVDGVYQNARMDDRQCLLVVIGARADGTKEPLAIEGGYRESEQSWIEVLTDLKRRGLTQAPKVAVGDGALGFWKALGQVYAETRSQLCWVHKTANVLNKLPKRAHARAKAAIHEIWMAERRDLAVNAFETFVETYQAKYPKAVECLVKDRDALLTFYDFPAEHWQHLRTTNPIESTFATVRLRTRKTRGCLSRVTALTMTFKLMESAAKRWRRLNSPALVEKVVWGVQFVDGEEQESRAA